MPTSQLVVEPAEDRVRIGLPVREAVDIGIEGGYPVNIVSDGDGSSVEMALGPCETAILHLRQ